MGDELIAQMRITQSRDNIEGYTGEQQSNGKSIKRSNAGDSSIKRPTLPLVLDAIAGDDFVATLVLNRITMREIPDKAIEEKRKLTIKSIKRSNAEDIREPTLSGGSPTRECTRALSGELTDVLGDDLRANAPSQERGNSSS